MTQTHLSIDFSGSDVASRRAAAITGFIEIGKRRVGKECRL